jgi:predicted MFS family arabinose efflux permease
VTAVEPVQPKAAEATAQIPLAVRRWGWIPVPSFTAMGYRDYRLWWASSAAVMLDRGMAQIALSWLVLELTNSSLWVGLTIFATGLPMFLFTLPAGLGADRWNRRRLLIWAQLVGALSAAGFATVVAFGWATPELALGYAFLSGSTLAFSMPASRALIPMLVPRDHVLNAVALGSISQNTSRLVGPALAGLLIAGFGVAASLYVQAALILLGLVALFLVRLPAQLPSARGAGGRSSVWADVKEGGGFLSANRPLLVLIGLMLVTGLFMMGPHQTVLPVIVRDHLKVGSAGFGITVTAMSLGSITTSLFLTSMGGMPNKGGFFAMALIGGSVCFAGYVLSPWYALALVFFYVWGGFGGFFANMSQSLLQTHTPGPMMGRVMAVNTLAMQGFLPLGALQAGVIASVAGPQTAGVVSAVTCALLAATALVFAPRFRRLA